VLLQHEQRQITTQRIDPKIIVANTILQLSAVELTQSIEAELMENPALEVLDDASCSGDCIDKDSCPYCSLRRASASDSDPSGETPDSGDHDIEFDPSFGITESLRDDDQDPVGNIGTEITLKEHLLGLLRATVSEADYYIGEYIINNLNQRGWLGDTIESIALDLTLPESEVCRLLKVIQSFDPPGVGAQNIQECLLLQIQYLQEENPKGARARINRLAEQMVRECFEHIPLHRYSKIARMMGITAEETKQVIDYIGTRLNPYPAHQFRSPWANGTAEGKSSVRPDVVIRRSEYGYDVEVVGSDTAGLSINPLYRDLYNSIKCGSTQHTSDYRRHVLEYVDRAEMFIRNINQRRQSLRLITRCIIDFQTGFLETGSRQFLRPLTRTRVAQLLEIHESTVSRATANKFVQLPNQEVMSYNVFFNSSLSVKDVIESMIHSENPASPLSDQQIVEQLANKGIHVARRTVVKYRDTLKILSSTRRRR
jgi:RNA polymerase sigma-54 factor